jgi:hypothetical protein
VHPSCQTLGVMSILKLLALLLGAIVVGPAVACLAVSAGCYGETPLFGVLCGHNAYFTLVALTLLTWVAIAVWASLRTGKQR